MEPFINRPTDLADFLAYLTAYAPHFPDEDRYTNASAFGEAFDALDRFASSCKSEEGREAVLQCTRHLPTAYTCYEDDDDFTGCLTVQEVEELFRKARRFIPISDA